MGYTQHVYSTSHAGCIKAYERNFEQVNGGERSAQPANDDATFAGDRFWEYDQVYEYQDNEYEDSKEDNDNNDDDIEGMFSSFVCRNIFINKSR